MRECWKCKYKMELIFFAKNQGICKKCRAREYYANKNKHYKSSDNSRCLRLYGITRIEYDLKVASQNGKCGEVPKNPLHLDHCHVSGNLREMLCSKCNQGLGLFRDNVELLNKAIKYLKKHNKAS